MSFSIRHLLALVPCIGIVAIAACGGGHPGGTVGDICFDVGSSRECFDDEVCDDVDPQFDGPYCLLRCDKDKECAAFEECNGVSGGGGKACHPH